MQRLSSILPAVLHKRGLHDVARASQIVAAATQWLHAAMPHCAMDITPKALERGQLVIEAKHSIALAECSEAAPLLLRHLASVVPDVPLRGVRLVRT